MSDTARMRQVIADELNRRPSEIIGSPSLTVESAINREINAALSHYAGLRTWWMEKKDSVVGVTVDGTRSYSLSSDVIKPDSIKLEYNNSYIYLIETTWDEMEEQDRQITGSKGIPQDFVIYGNELRMYPVPNQSMTILMSYTMRPRLTSLTGSTTASGTSTASPSSSGSHHNQVGGWYVYGESLIRHRAKAGVLINYLRDTHARQQAALLASGNMEFLSMEEKQAYTQVRDEVNDRIAAGKTQPYYV